MNELTSEPWFGWALALAIGLPTALIALTELHRRLLRRGSPLAALVAMVRNLVLPAGAVLALLTKAWELSAEATWVRVIATLFGFLVLLATLSGLNTVIFSRAGTGTWRQRMPSIFVDIARLVLVVVGLAILFAWVWDADVGGLFAALGVTSIVLGFALQNAVGSIISGLLLLFEQPFHLGDWLDTGSVRGRVVEVNWRAIHLDTGDGIQVVPNAELAGASFTNLGAPAGNHVVSIPTAFAADDPPDLVRALLDAVAADLPSRHPDTSPSTVMTAPHRYTTHVPVLTPADEDAVVTTFLRWTWYASRRHGFHLDGAADGRPANDELEAALRPVASALQLDDREVVELLPLVTLERWGNGEMLQRAGTVPDGMRFLIAGQVMVTRPAPAGPVPVSTLGVGEFFGQTTLTRERVLADIVATSEVTTLLTPQGVVDELVRTHPVLARELGQAIDRRRAQTLAASPSETTSTSTTTTTTATATRTFIGG